MTSMLPIIASNAIIAAVLAVFVCAVTKIWKSPQLAHALWLLVLVKLITPPIAPVSVPANRLVESGFPKDSTTANVQTVDVDKFANPLEMPDSTDEIRPMPDAAKAGLYANVQDEPSHATAPTTNVGPIDVRSESSLKKRPVEAMAAYAALAAAIVWITGVLLYLLFLVGQCICFRRLLGASHKADAELIDSANRIASKLGLNRRPPIRVVDASIPPLVWCLGVRPTVVLPKRLLAALTPAQRDAVIAHELAHVRRRDHLVRWLEVFALALFWWNPVAWFASRKLREAEEECCDAWVVWALPEDRRSYGKAMFKTIEFLADGSTLPALAGSAFGSSFYKRRIEMIMKRSMNHKMSWTAFAVAALVAMAVLPIAAQTGAQTIETATPFSASGDTNGSQKSETSKPHEGNDASTPRPPERNSEAAAQPTENGKNERTGQKDEVVFRFQGRVVAPGGKPVRGAKIYLYQWQQTESAQLAQSKENGEFSFEIKPSNELYPHIAEEGGMFVAVADGFGLAVKSAHECETTGALARAFQQRAESSGMSAAAERFLKRILTRSPTFQLTDDSLPISGRVVDIQGRPISGAKIYVCKISDAGRGGLEAWEKAAKAPNADQYSTRQQLGLTVGNDVGGVVLNFITPATTDDKGGFALQGIGRDRVVKLLIAGPGVETMEVFARTRAGEAIEINKEPRNPALGKILYHPASFTQVAGPSQPVVGTVVDAKSKKPLADVTIQSYQLAGRRMAGWTEGIVRTKTDAQGRFRLEGLPIGENEVLALSRIDEPYIVTRHRAITKTNKEPLRLDIELTRGLWIHGRAFDAATDQPIRSGRVDYYALTDNPHARKVNGFNGAHLSTRYRLRPDGTYRIPGLPGRGIVCVMADRDHDKYQRGVGADEIEGKDEQFNGFRTYPTILSSFNYHIFVGVNPAVDADSLEVNFPFSSGRTVHVSVVDADGKPVTGCEYTGKMEFNAWRQAQGDQLEIFGYQPDKPRRVQVLHKKRKLAGFIVLKDAKPDKLAITLQPWAEIKGRIVDQAGAPKADVEINDIYDDSRDRPDVAVLPPGENWQTGKYFTDDEGRFHIAGLMPGYKFSMGVSEQRKDGIGYYLGDLRPDVELEPGEVHDLGDLKLEKRGNE